MASFGTAFPVNDSVKYGKETVGLAVYVPTSAKELVQDANNNMVLLEWAPTIRYFFIKYIFIYFKIIFYYI